MVLNHFYAGKTYQIYVNVCDVCKILAGVLQCNGGKLEKSDDFNCIFVVRIDIDQLHFVNC